MRMPWGWRKEEDDDALVPHLASLGVGLAGEHPGAPQSTLRSPSRSGSPARAQQNLGIKLLWRARLQKEPLAQQMARNKRIAVTRCTFHCSYSDFLYSCTSPGKGDINFQLHNFFPLSVLSCWGLRYVRICWTLFQLKTKFL